MGYHPPKWADRFLQWYCKPELLEEIQGDAYELFDRRLAEEGIANANRKFAWDVLRFFRWSNIKKSNKLKINSFVMFKSYVKIGFRNLSKNWAISTINIFGLALAIGCAITTFIFMDNQYSMDGFHSKKEVVYQVTNHVKNEHSTDHWGDAPLLVGPALADNNSFISRQARVEYQRGNVRWGDNVFSELVSFIDPDFMYMFDFPLQSGNRDVLKDKKNILISQYAAQKYFGVEDPMGKTMSIKYGDGKIQNYTVGAVYEKFPSNASIRFSFVIPMDNFFDLTPDKTYDWGYLTDAVFVEFEPGHSPAELDDQMQSYLEDHNAVDAEWTIDHFEFVPLKDLSLRDHEIMGGVAQGGHPAGRIALSTIALILLILACFNYMNIAIASATKRLKEIAMRKVMGGAKRQIIHQFLTENLILCVFAMLLGIGLSYYFFLPGFNAMIPFTIPFTFSSFKLAVIFFGALLLLIGLASGAYPAFYISRFQPVSIFKGSQKFGSKTIFSRVLLGFQLILAFITVVGGFVFTDNALYLNNRSWGYDPSGIISIPVANESQLAALKKEANSNPLVEDYAVSYGHLGHWDGISTVDHLGSQVKTYIYRVTANYPELMGLNIIEGQSFDRSIQSAQSNVALINETYARKMGWENPLDEQISYDSINFNVVGVIEDYFLQNFYGEKQAAFFIIGGQEKFNHFTFKVAQDKIYEAEEAFQAAWFEVAPNDPFDRIFQKDTFDDFYTENNANTALIGTISAFAVILACLGLFGLLTFNLQKRMKEFGVRKVLGANRLSIVKQANKEYVWVIAISFVLGAPVGYMLIDLLIQQIYADPKAAGPFPFILSIVIMILTIALTVTGQILKATNINPSEILRNE